MTSLYQPLMAVPDSPLVKRKKASTLAPGLRMPSTPLINPVPLDAQPISATSPESRPAYDEGTPRIPSTLRAGPAMAEPDSGVPAPRAAATAPYVPPPPPDLNPSTLGGPKILTKTAPSDATPSIPAGPMMYDPSRNEPEIAIENENMNPPGGRVSPPATPNVNPIPFDWTQLLAGFKPQQKPSSTPMTTAAIDPANDMRSKTILPTEDADTEAARRGMMTSLGKAQGFDRTQAMQEVLSKMGLPAGANVDPKEMERLLAEIGSTDTTGRGLKLGDDIFSRFGNTNVTAREGPALGKDYTGDLGTADQTMMAQLQKLVGTDRGAEATRLRDELTKYFGNTDVELGPEIMPKSSDRLNEYSSMVDEATKGLAGVDRVKAAQDMWKQFEESTNPEYDLSMKKATERAAAAGGLRSGMLRTDYGNLADRRNQQLDLEKRRLMTDALLGSIDDQFRKTGMLSDLEGRVRGAEAGERDEMRGERDYRTGVQTGNVNRSLSTKQTAAGMASSEADKNIGAGADTFRAAQSVSGDLAQRQAQRRQEERIDRDYKTAIEQGNVERAAALRRQADEMGVRLAGDEQAGRRATLDTMTGISDRNRSAADADRRFAAGEADSQLDGIMRTLSAGEGTFGTLANEGYRKRGETRGERGYENDMERQAFERRVLQQQMEQQEEEARVRRALALLSAGEAGNPANTMLNGAGEGFDPAWIQQFMQAMSSRGG